MTETRLVLRLLRGAGPAGLVRLLLMVAGVAIGVMVSLLVLELPTVLAVRGNVTSDRMPIQVPDIDVYGNSGSGDASRGPAEDGPTSQKQQDGSFLFQVANGAWAGKPFTRVLVSTQGSALPPLPPGVSAWPGPGEVVLSPAAKASAIADAEFARLVPGRMVGDIGPAGLLGPDELYAYIGVRSSDLGNPSRGQSWGGSGYDLAVQQQFGHVPEELALILVGPMVIYIIVCARLAAATRRRRYAAFRLLGMTARTILRVAFLESALSGMFGAFMGITFYEAMNRWIGPSGILGFTWYRWTSQPSLIALVLVVTVVAVAAGIVASAATNRSIFSPLEARFEGADRAARWWHAIPFMFGIGIIAYVLITTSKHHGMAAGATLVLLFGVLCSTLGLLFALRPLLIELARMTASRASSLAARLAARRFQHEGTGLLWHLSGLSVVVLVACVSMSVVRGMELAASPSDPGSQLVHVNLSEIAAAERPEAIALPSDKHWLTVHSEVAPPSGPTPPITAEDYVRRLGVGLIVADCTTLRKITGESLMECNDGQSYRIVGDMAAGVPSLQAGTPVSFQDASGIPTTILAPEATLSIDQPGPLMRGMNILYAGNISPIGLPAGGILSFELGPGINSFDDFASRIAQIAPGCTIDTDSMDVASLETYRVYHGSMESGMFCAFMLCLIAFLISVYARGAERRREVVALVVIGAPTKLLRAVQCYQLLVPLACTLLASTGVGFLAGNALLLKSPGQSGWYAGGLSLAGVLAGIALIIATATGTLVIGNRPTSEDLRRE